MAAATPEAGALCLARRPLPRAVAVRGPCSLAAFSQAAGGLFRCCFLRAFPDITACPPQFLPRSTPPRALTFVVTRRPTTSIPVQTKKGVEKGVKKRHRAETRMALSGGGG